MAARPSFAPQNCKDMKNTMRALIATVTSILLVAGVAPALAQSATKIGQHSAWGTYSYQAQNGKVCYVLTVPTEKTPKTLDHGDIFFFEGLRYRRRQVLLHVYAGQVRMGRERG